MTLWPPTAAAPPPDAPIASAKPPLCVQLQCIQGTYYDPHPQVWVLYDNGEVWVSEGEGWRRVALPHD